MKLFLSPPLALSVRPEPEWPEPNSQSTLRSESALYHVMEKCPIEMPPESGVPLTQKPSDQVTSYDRSTSTRKRNCPHGDSSRAFVDQSDPPGADITLSHISSDVNR
ncbi:hypothetical protein Bbelb_224810 [Branchiostoma belcheri]|nr:hypothetical protein Bbelb_224810 [Branchiostoma belcheri]